MGLDRSFLAGYAIFFNLFSFFRIGSKGESAYISRSFTRQEETWYRVVQEARSRGEPPPSVLRVVGLWENSMEPVVHLAVTEPTAEVGVIRVTKVDWRASEAVTAVFFRYLVTQGVWDAVLKTVRESITCAPWLRAITASIYIPGSTLYHLEEAGLDIPLKQEEIRTADPALHIALYLLDQAIPGRVREAETKAALWQKMVETFAERLTAMGLSAPVEAWPAWEEVAPPEMVEDEAQVVSAEGARSLRRVTAVEEGLATSA